MIEFYGMDALIYTDPSFYGAVSPDSFPQSGSAFIHTIQVDRRASKWLHSDLEPMV